jgi:ERCC4-related helicase
MFTIGQRITTRGEDFLVTNLREVSTESTLLDVQGISELVRGRNYCFDTALEKDIRPLDPRQTLLVADNNAGYRQTRLFLESQIRNAAVYSDRIVIANKAAFNLSEYQLDPTLKALKLPRPRLLLADGVGLGKTVEVGILLTELMKRGKAQRILVLALKSILGQFQQEIWQRFDIPLVRLDSVGLARVKAELPANKNPFDYYDKTIISIDTLKNNAKFRHYLEKSRWDIIVIDECHTVANDESMRGDLAQLLAQQCEALILTSATPHNGVAERFANLIRMLEPTAIPRSGSYTADHVRPYFIRRFKHDIKDENVRRNFQDREIIRLPAKLGPLEESILSLQHAQFTALPGKVNRKSADALFATLVFKAFLSSPAAALSSVQERIKKAKEVTGKPDSEDAAFASLANLTQLDKSLQGLLEEAIDAKYAALVKELRRLGWLGRQQDERFVVFAERRDTLDYLEQRIKRDFRTDNKRIQQFHGSLSDVEQQLILDEFGSEECEIRLLLCSDAGSQGVNLHYYCHRMFNYDIPWSLITLEQRNGRIDRYGQREKPMIYYLVAESDQAELKTDFYIIERLIEKEKEVKETLGDAGAVMRLYDVRREEKAVDDALRGQDPNYLDKPLVNDTVEEDAFDLDALLNAAAAAPDGGPTEPNLYETLPSFYASDETFYRDLFEQLESSRLIGTGEVSIYDNGEYVEVQNTAELNHVMFNLPSEAKPRQNELYKLTTRRDRVMQAIEEARREPGKWAKFQLLYELHPVVRYFLTKLEASVAKDSALVAKHAGLPAASAWFVLQGQSSNNLGQPVVADFYVVPLRMDGSLLRKAYPLTAFVEEFKMRGNLYSQSMPPAEVEQLQVILPDAIDFGLNYMLEAQSSLEEVMEIRLSEYETKLENWKTESLSQLELAFEGASVITPSNKRDQKALHEIETILSESSQFLKDLHSLQNEPFLKVLAVFYNA